MRVLRTPEGYDPLYQIAYQRWTMATPATAGDVGAHTVFTVTGAVVAHVLARCADDLVSAGGGDVEVGTSDGVDCFCGLLTTAQDLDVNELWLHPQATLPSRTIPLAGTVKNIENFQRGVLLNERDIIMTVVVADITAGIIEFVCRWKPLFPGGGLVVPATIV